MKRSIKFTHKIFFLFLLVWSSEQNLFASASIARAGSKIATKVVRYVNRNPYLLNSFTSVNNPELNLWGSHMSKLHIDAYANQGKKSVFPIDVHEELAKMDQRYHDIFAGAIKQLQEGNYEEAFETYSSLYYSENFPQFNKNYAQMTCDVARESIEENNFLLAKKALRLLDPANQDKLELAKELSEKSNESVIDAVGGTAHYSDILFFRFALRFVNHPSENLSNELLSLQNTTRDFLTPYLSQGKQFISPNFNKFIKKLADDRGLELLFRTIEDEEISRLYQDFFEAHTIWKEKLFDLLS